MLLAFVPRLGNAYYLALAISLLQYTVLATAWGMFSGPTRYVSLATTAFFGVGAYTVAVLGEILPWPLVLLIAAALGAIVAAIVGLSTLRLSGVYFVIFTFGLTELIRQLVVWFEVNKSRVLGRYVFVDITQADIYWQLLALTAAVFLLGWLIARSRLGFALRVIGEDETVAKHCGIDTTFAKVALFTISATVMTLVGAIMAPRWTYIEPSIAFNSMISFQVLIMALLGGAHRLWGPVLGAVPLTLLFELLSARFPNTFTIILGCIFLLIVYMLPRGVAGLFEKLAADAGRQNHATGGRMSQDTATRVLEVDGLRRALRRAGRGQRPRLCGRGQARSSGLLGPNGSGKTTALNLMSGVLRPDAGTIRLTGRDIAGLAVVPDRAARPGADVPARPRARRHGLPRERQGGAGVPEAASAAPLRPRCRDRHAARSRRPCRARTGGRRPTSPISTASGWSWPARSPPSRGCCCSTNGSRASIRPNCMIGIDLIRSLKADGHHHRAGRACDGRGPRAVRPLRRDEQRPQDRRRRDRRCSQRCGCREGLSWRGGRRCLRSPISAWPMACIARSTASRCNVGARRDRHDPRRQWRGQDLAAEGHRRRRADASGQAGEPRRPRYLGDSPAHEIVESGLALVPEGRGIFGDLTVKENLLLGANPKRARDGEAARREQVLELFPRLRERAAQIARTMSGGEQQMVAIGRALMSNPDILLLDEPSLGLSPAMVQELFATLAAGARGRRRTCCSSSRTRRRACGSPTAAMCSKTASSSGTARADHLKSDPAVQRAYLGGALPAAAPSS